jgi:hypothetical protein
VIKTLVNHAPSTDVTLGYVITDEGRLRDSAEKIANRLRELCKINDLTTGDNVERLAQK